MRPLPLVAAALVLAFIVWRWRRSSTERRLVALGIVAALGVYGSGLVDLPNVEKLIEDAGDTLGRWTYVLVGAMTFLETGAFLSFVAPGEFTILFGGLVAGQGKISVVVLIAVVWTCAVLGDTTSFYIGRRLGRDFLLRHGARVKITNERLEQVERFYDRHGGITVFIGRFVGVLRALGPFIAGASKMPYRRFLPYDILGGGLWSTILVLLGYIFWRSFDRLKTIVGQGFFALGTLIAVVAATVWAVRFFRVPENRAKTDAWLAEQERKTLARPFVRAVRWVGARVVWPLAQWAGPPLRFLWNRLTPGQLGLELTTLFAIAAVGSFAFIGNWILLENEPPLDIDADGLRTVDDLRDPTAVDVADVLTDLGSLPVVLAVTVAATVFLLLRRRVVEALPLFAGLLITYLGVHIAKPSLDRPRPEGGLVEASGSSYPSGHAAYGMAYVAIAVAVVHAAPGMVRKTLVVALALVLAASIGLSRLYLRVHYITDVLGGWGLAAAAFSLCGIVTLIVGHLRQNGRAPRPEPTRPAADRANAT